MDRLLIVPAAGRGSRLGLPAPKALVPVAGRPMLEHLAALHGDTVDRFVLVVAPAAVGDFEAFAADQSVAIELAIQPEPTGMLDAILAASAVVQRHRPPRVAVTWCDQIALRRSTVVDVRERGLAPDAPALVVATITVADPYIHFDRGTDGRICAVRHRREGDQMPATGETDLGLFDLSLNAYLHDLREFAQSAAAAAGTGERNFLPFIPWMALRGSVATVPGGSPIEAVGINTPEELAAVEAHLLREA